VSESKRIWRSGVRFDCPDCGKLLVHDAEHSNQIDRGCPVCSGDLRLVGKGDKKVESAEWYRCLACRRLFMKRRGEVVETRPRSGFEEFATL
jgi:transposase-like protein